MSKRQGRCWGGIRRVGVLFWLPACQPRSACRAGISRICTLSRYRNSGEKLLEKNEEITGVQKSAGASGYQRQTGDVQYLLKLIAQCFISFLWEEPFRYLVFAAAVCVRAHENSVSFYSLFSLMLPGGHTLPSLPSMKNWIFSFNLLLAQLWLQLFKCYK